MNPTMSVSIRLFIWFRRLSAIFQRRTFDLTLLEHDKDRADDLRRINAVIERLAARRKARIEIEGPFLRSKLAWKAATYQEAVLYRIVMLARGVRLCWNARNTLASFLLVRALVETAAVFDEFERELLAGLEREDLGAIDQLVMNRTFATKDRELLKEYPEHSAVNVLTFIDKLEKRHDLPVRANYDSLSERCHPNSAGHHQMYSTTDKRNGTVTFSETKHLTASLDYIIAPLGLVLLFERSMARIDEAIQRLADLHHRVHPVV
jgi:hypothetical protein